MLNKKINLLCKNLKLIITDVDGVLTDGGMYYLESGKIFKKFNTRDGMGVELLLKNNIKATVVNLHTIKPLDEKLILKLAETTGAFVTVEEHQVSGGMGSAVAEFIVKNNLVPIEMLGIEDTFGESGNADKLLTKYGLTVANIVKKAKLVVKRK